MPIYFDLSTTYRALGSKPWGMLRVEKCIGWELQKHNVCFLRFHKRAGGFVKAQPNFAIARNLAEIEQLIFAQPILPHRYNADIIYNLFRVRRFIRRVKDFKTDQIIRRITWIFAHYYMYFDVKLREDFFALLSAGTPQSDLFSLLNHFLDQSTRGTELAAIGKDDIFICTGQLEQAEYIDDIERMAEQGTRVFLLIHDILPMTMPCLYPFWTSDQRTNYQTLCARLFSSQANLLTISHFTQQQMTVYCRDSLGLDKKAQLIKLASSGGFEPFHHAGANIVRTKHSSADTDPVFKMINRKGFEFALMVSSYQKRKNQIPLLNVWRQAIQGISHPPALIFAGLHCDPDYEAALIELIGGDPNVILFFDLPDEAFDLLYQNCLFTLFPSQGEGWGLPISESLGYGKYCLTGNNTSLPEVGEGVTFAADLVGNEAEWITEIRKLLTNRSYLKQKSDAIKANITPRTWNDVAADILRAALTPGLIQG